MAHSLVLPAEIAMTYSPGAHGTVAPSFPSLRRRGRGRLGGSVRPALNRTPTGYPLGALPRSEGEGAEIRVTVFAAAGT